jgi:AraC-like DNA-binding protein
MQLGCAGNRNDPRLLGKQPSKRKLSRCRLLLLREFAQQINQRLVRFTVLWVKAWDGVAESVAASEDVPLLSLLMKLDMVVVREILSQEEFHALDGSSRVRGITIGKTTVDLLQPFCRLLDLLDASEDIPFLSNLIQREIVYRPLRGPQGERLRAIATLGDQSHRTAKAIAWLRANYRKPLRVEELAEVARMGMSTLHHHFRALTAMSPLQYQKQLRLVAARERMLVEGIDAASAAFEVGYESASQFNREYKSFFGQPPMRDIKVRRLAGSAMVSD